MTSQSVPDMVGRIVSIYHNGFRHGRVTHCLFDTERQRVENLDVVLLGGDPDTHGGFNGTELVLRNRKQFTGAWGGILGVLIGKRKVRNIDVYAAGQLQMKGSRPREEESTPGVIVAAKREPSTGEPEPAVQPEADEDELHEADVPADDSAAEAAAAGTADEVDEYDSHLDDLFGI